MDLMGWDLQPAGPGVPTTRATGTTSTRPGLPIPAKPPQPWNSRAVQARFPDGCEGSLDILRELRAGILGAGKTHLPKLWIIFPKFLIDSNPTLKINQVT